MTTQGRFEGKQGYEFWTIEHEYRNVYRFIYGMGNCQFVVVFQFDTMDLVLHFVSKEYLSGSHKRCNSSAIIQCLPFLLLL